MKLRITKRDHAMTDEHFMPQAYHVALEAARGLLAEQIRNPDGERNAEYTRGIVELIADAFGYLPDEPDMGAAKVRILGRLGLPPRATEPSRVEHGIIIDQPTTISDGEST